MKELGMRYVENNMNLKDQPAQKTERASVGVLRECIDLQTRKAQDYQSDASGIKQAQHYPRGVATIADMVHQKMVRVYSVMAKIEAGETVNFESLEDSFKDAINYCSFAVSYIRGEMDGQDPACDIFNRRNKVN